MWLATHNLYQVSHGHYWPLNLVCKLFSHILLVCLFNFISLMSSFASWSLFQIFFQSVVWCYQEFSLSFKTNGWKSEKKARGRLFPPGETRWRISGFRIYLRWSSWGLEKKVRLEGKLFYSFAYQGMKKQRVAILKIISS